MRSPARYAAARMTLDPLLRERTFIRRKYFAPIHASLRCARISHSAFHTLPAATVKWTWGCEYRSIQEPNAKDGPETGGGGFAEWSKAKLLLDRGSPRHSKHG